MRIGATSPSGTMVIGRGWMTLMPETSRCMTTAPCEPTDLGVSTGERRIRCAPAAAARECARATDSGSMVASGHPGTAFRDTTKLSLFVKIGRDIGYRLGQVKDSALNLRHRLDPKRFALANRSVFANALCSTGVGDEVFDDGRHGLMKLGALPTWSLPMIVKPANYIRVGDFRSVCNESVWRHL